MRDQSTAVRDAREHAGDLVDALQDADAPESVIRDAEALHLRVCALIGVENKIVNSISDKTRAC